MTALAALPPGSTVSFTANAISGTAPVTIRFANTSTKAGPYSWSFGDGKTSASASPKHLYKRPGTYTATLTSTGGGKSASVSISVASGGKVSVRLSRKSFEHSQAGKVKLVYRFSSPSESFKYRLERRSGAKWRLVRNVRRNGGFRGAHSLTMKQLFGSTTIETGRYRLTLSADASQSLLGFEAT